MLNSSYLLQLFLHRLAYAPYLVVIALIGSVVALFYYLYVAKLVIVDAPSHKLQSSPDEGPSFDFAKLTAVITTVLLVVFSVWGMEFP